MSKPFRVYLVMSKIAREAYIGKGEDSRIDQVHTKEFQRLKRQPDVVEWASEPFSTENDALIAEAIAIGIANRFGAKLKLQNKQKSYLTRFGPRYPFEIVAKEVKKSQLPLAIIVTLKPDKLPDEDSRVAPNSPGWKPKQLAERARMWWAFDASRVRSWQSGKGPPKYLVAVAKGSGRIVGVFEIDNKKWMLNANGLYDAVPVKTRTANANGMQGQKYIGDRRGGLVSYGSKVA
jgi:hypothetical protein